MKVINYNDQSTLFILSIIKIFITYYQLFYTNFDPLFKVLLFYPIDLIDCDVGFSLKLYSNYNFCETELYQKMDKITDTIGYIMLSYYINKTKLLENGELMMINSLLLYRIIGVGLFLVNNNRKYLVHFPNFFFEVVLALLAFGQLDIDKKYKSIALCVVMVIKIIQEYIMHWNK
jgi:hypothetical protein